MRVTLPNKPLAAVVREAMTGRRYQDAHWERITVNHLRHTCPEYVKAIRSGLHPVVYQDVKRQVLEVIASRYGQLAGECRRQLVSLASGKEREVCEKTSKCRQTRS